MINIKTFNPTCKFAAKKAGNPRKEYFFTSDYKAVMILSKNRQISIYLTVSYIENISLKSCPP